jgi:DNA polymerase-3 subunit epsilon
MLTRDQAEKGCQCDLSPPDIQCYFCQDITEMEKEHLAAGTLLEYIDVRDGPGPFLLFADTETTGLPAKGAYSNPHHPETPHLVELCAVLTDQLGFCVARLHRIIKPEGYEIPKQASDVHGITTQMAMDNGVPLWQAIWELDRLVNRASELVMHNHQFDRLILKASHLRLGIPHGFRRAKKVCTMMLSTKICKVPHANGRGGYKWPTLAEAYRHFFNEEVDGAHGAVADATACMRIYFHMLHNGLIHEPQA